MRDYFRGLRPWAQLENLAKRLPQESHYKAALADDDEMAELLVRLGMGDQEGPPPLVGYSNLDAKLDSLINEVRLLRTDQANLTPGVQGKARFTPVPRPVTALDRARSKAREDRLSDLEQRVMPKG